MELELTYTGKTEASELLANAAASNSKLHIDRHYLRGTKGWRNIIAFGDNLHFLNAAYANSDPIIKDKIKSQVKLIYIDPPFATSSDFKANDGARAYSDKKTGAEFIEFLRQRLILAREVLAEDGSIYVHLDQKMSHYIKVVMDEVFGREYFQNEIVWQYRTGGARNKKWSQKHDIILFYTKSSRWLFNPQMEKAYTRSESRKPGIIDYGAGTAEFFEDKDGVYNWVRARDVWDIPYINSRALERTGYPTQKPEALLKKIIEASTNHDDLVLDFFGGSGVTMSVAEKLGRRWIVCDMGKLSYLTMQKRILQLPDCRDFITIRLSDSEQAPSKFSLITPPKVSYELATDNGDDTVWLKVHSFTCFDNAANENGLDALSAIFIDRDYDGRHFHIDEKLLVGRQSFNNSCIKIPLRDYNPIRQTAIVFYDKYGNDYSNF